MGWQEKDGSGCSEFSSTLDLVLRCFPSNCYHSGNVSSVARDGHYTDTPVISGIKGMHIYLKLVQRYST